MSETQQSILKRVIAKAWTNPQFAEQLRTAPREVLELEGMTFAPGEGVVVHFNDANTRHFTIPAAPAEIEIANEEIVRLAAARMQVVTQAA